MSIIVFPWDPVTEKGFDMMFMPEVKVARDAGFTVFSVNHDGLQSGVFKVRNTPETPCEAVYRGWMVSVEEYQFLYDSLLEKGVTLISTPEQYATAHHLNGWLDTMHDLTFDTMILPPDANDDFLRKMVTSTGWRLFFVKDFVKSYSVVNGMPLTQWEVVSAVKGLREERGGQLTGGLVLRRFTHLVPNRVEMRGWWVDGQWRALTVHPDYSGEEPWTVPQDLLDEVSSRLSSLNLRFVTADFAKSQEGWKLVEIGDGQVSSFPDNVSDETVKAVLTR